MAFGFAVERFGLFMHMLLGARAEKTADASFWFGLIFVALGCFFSFVAAMQYRTVLRSLKAAEFPPHYNPQFAFWINALMGVLALVLAIYLVKSTLF